MQSHSAEKCKSTNLDAFPLADPVISVNMSTAHTFCYLTKKLAIVAVALIFF